ncbi:hypothetical protein EsH8_II_001589 [Colletotrichum jinshuiense]
MGDLAFGKSFKMLEGGTKHHFMTDLHKNLQTVGMFSHMIWLLPVFKKTPILNSKHKRFWYFVKSQVDERIKRLRKEIDDYFAHNAIVEHLPLSKLQYLQACIDETLRLHPTVPSGLQRMTPPEGMEIDGTFIPGNTIVQVPSHTMFRGKSLFSVLRESGRD